MLRVAAGRKEALMVADTGKERKQKDTSGKGKVQLVKKELLSCVQIIHQSSHANPAEIRTRPMPADNEAICVIAVKLLQHARSKCREWHVKCSRVRYFLPPAE